MKNPEMRKKTEALVSTLLPNLADYVEKYAKLLKDKTAIIEHNTGDIVSWKKFNTSVSAFAAKLLAIGLKKGDIVATSLPLLKEHVYLIYACYRVGIVIAPLDLRLKTKEIQYSLDKIKPKAYFFLGKTPVIDFRPMIEEVMKNSPYVKHWVQFQKEPDLIIKGAIGISDFAKDIKKKFIISLITGSVRRARRNVDCRDACLIIFTTGSTGSPKPALLCHENILIQNVGQVTAFELSPTDKMLVNLPASHVGCTTEQLASSIYGGGTFVILHVFDAEKSLEAIDKHKITVVGQIPALFNMQWRLPNFKSYNLSSLRFLLYGGQAVSKDFLLKMKEMAPKIGTGLGLTETAGFCTYTDVNATVDEIVQGIGYDIPATPITIRKPMQTNGLAGELVKVGEIGEICFTGKQIFLGYLNDSENTAKCISKDGICYTGDLGYYDENGLHFSGRSKLVIKPKGYQVFPEDVENYIQMSLSNKVAAVAIVGTEHQVFQEAIMAFVEVKDNCALSPEEVMSACANISSYSRPSHVEILPAGQLPLNRVAKTDYMELKRRATEIVENLRKQGKWDKE